MEIMSTMTPPRDGKLWVVAFVWTGDGDPAWQRSAFRDVSGGNTGVRCVGSRVTKIGKMTGLEGYDVANLVKKALSSPEADKCAQSARDLSACPCLGWAFLARPI